MPSSSAALEPWILGVIVGGAVLALILVVLAVFFLLKRRRAQEPAAASNNSAVELKQPQSDYVAISLAPPDDYAELGFKAKDDQPPPSDYAVVPAKSSDYDSGRMNIDDAAAASASEYNVGRLP
jgi:hypothetical protein